MPLILPLPANMSTAERPIKARYEEIAKKNNLSLQEVQALALEQAERATLAGNYVQNASGAWVKK